MEQVADSNIKIEKTKKISPFIEFLQSVVAAIGICVVVYIFIATPNQVDGLSMNPTLENGEIILTIKLSQWLGGTPFGKSIGLDYNRGDIIVFQKPGYRDLVKRIIGLPGDSIAIKNGKVFINKEELKEDYIAENIRTNGGSFLQDGENPLIVPENNYFVMGDNRNNSHDSRYKDIGFIDRSWMKGRVLIRYWPLNKITVINLPDYQ